MPETNSFLPIWPPQTDDDFAAWPEVREARKMYRAQKDCLKALATQAMQSTSGTETHYLSQEIASLLHNISGTGAHFGDAAFGIRAGELEQPVRGAFSADLLRPYCVELLASLRDPGDD